MGDPNQANTGAGDATAKTDVEIGLTAAMSSLFARLHMAAAMLPNEIEGELFQELLDTLSKAREAQAPEKRARVNRIVAVLHAAREFKIEARAFQNA